MKRLFFTSLITVLSVTLITFLLAGIAISAGYAAEERQWKSEAYDEYVSYIGSMLEDGSFNVLGGPAGARVKLQILPTDKVTGLMYTDESTGASFAVGATPIGLTLPDSGTQEGSREARIKLTETRFLITYTAYGQMDVTTETEKKTVTVDLPRGVRGSDIAGSVSFIVNGTRKGTVYVLVHSPRTYTVSGEILEDLLRYLLLIVPVALLISLIIAWVYSYRNTQRIASIRSALLSLTEPGHESPSAPRESIPFVREIYTAIGELDRTLRENQKSRNEWLRTISHDLNTPLTSLKITLEGIRDGVFSPSDAQVLQNLILGTAALESRVQAVTAYAKLEAIQEINRADFSAGEFVEDVLSSFPAEFASKIKREINVQTINADYDLLKEALTELIRNAGSSDPDASGITLSIGCTGPTFNISLTNAGTLPSDTDFFEPWARGDWSRHEGGPGLGLAVVARIIRTLHRGEARIVQESPGVVRATISWPVN